jgi:hypothetical protein
MMDSRWKAKTASPSTTRTAVSSGPRWRNEALATATRRWYRAAPPCAETNVSRPHMSVGGRLRIAGNLPVADAVRLADRLADQLYVLRHRGEPATRDRPLRPSTLRADDVTTMASGVCS